MTSSTNGREDLPDDDQLTEAGDSVNNDLDVAEEADHRLAGLPGRSLS